MGCATSKQKGKRRCRNCQAPARRSYSMHAHHDHHHHHRELEKFSFSTLGSFRFDLLDDQKLCIKEEEDNDSVSVSPVQKKDGFVTGMVEAKSWSKMIDEKIPKIVPKTPTRTPPGEPETINAWELMEGLEEVTSPPIVEQNPNSNQFRSFSFNLGPNFADYATPKVEFVKPLWAADNGDEEKVSDFEPEMVETFRRAVDEQPSKLASKEEVESIKPKIWSSENADDDEDDEEEESNSNSIISDSDFDPEVIETFRQTLQELPPANPFHLKPPLHQDTEFKKKKGNDDNNHSKLILYFTSLRGVRKTYEDCCKVRTILKGLGVKIDERDVSMHSGFKDELKELLLLEKKEEEEEERFTLPKVFIGRRCIGGAEEIRRMHEEGLLEKAVVDGGCQVAADDDGGGGVCEGCGDIRFVPCGTCYGSCKVYYQDDDDQECEESNCGFQPCLDCNENGLIRCPICCD